MTQIESDSISIIIILISFRSIWMKIVSKLPLGIFSFTYWSKKKKNENTYLELVRKYSNINNLRIDFVDMAVNVVSIQDDLSAFYLVRPFHCQCLVIVEDTPDQICTKIEIKKRTNNWIKWLNIQFLLLFREDMQICIRK